MKLGPTVGISVDHCHKNRLSLEGFLVNVQYLKDYKAKMDVFPSCMPHVLGEGIHEAFDLCILHSRDEVLMDGLCGIPRLGAVQGNAFGITFRSATEEAGADYFHELFEPSWIVLDSIAMNAFKIRLTKKLL